MDFAEAIAGHVRVNLGGADAGVAEQFLDDAQVRAVLQQMRREAVPEHVRGDIARRSGPAHASFDAQPQCYRGKRRSALRQEHIRGRFLRHEFGPAAVKVTVQRFNGFSPHRHNAFFVAFADDIDEACFEVQLFEPQIAQLRQPQPGCVGEFQYRLIA